MIFDIITMKRAIIMRKSVPWILILTVIAGICGFFLRKAELMTIFDETTGLALQWAPISMALGAVCVLFAVLLLLLLTSFDNRLFPKSCEQAFSFQSSGVIALFFTLFLIMIYGAGHLLSGYLCVGYFPTSEMVLAVLSVASSLCMLLSMLSIRRGKAGGDVAFYTVVPIAFYCFWLIWSYKYRAADPVLLDYIYELLAIVCSVLGAYFFSSFAFGRPKPKKLLFFSCAAAFLCITTLADAHPLPILLFFAVTAVVMLTNTVLLTKNVE
jgi:hypothetical protein